jgi:hypothetical protein
MFDLPLPRGRRIRRPTYPNTSPVPISATAMPCRPKPAANANAAIVSWLWAPETPAPGVYTVDRGTGLAEGVDLGGVLDHP